MSVRIFSPDYLDDLVAEARSSSRQRQHRNIHNDYFDPSQRLFNAIEPESYIRPHKHGLVPRAETLIAVRGNMALLVFDDQGDVVECIAFGVNTPPSAVAAGVEVPPNTWHTVVALAPGSILLEIKAGPFDPLRPKEFAPWSPAESSPDAAGYLESIGRRVAEAGLLV